MARSPFIVALAAGLAVLLATLHLVNQYGMPSIDYWHWRSDTKPVYASEGLSGQQPLEEKIASIDGDEYLVGVGKADITGPVVEINFMGYADPAQTGTGLRQRLYSRAFIVGDVEKPEDRFVYMVLDTQSGDTAIRHGILQGLRKMGHDYAVYGEHNVAVTGTHSHSGPGAWLNYLLPQITSRGFHKPSYQAIVDGAVASIKQAHRSLAPGKLSVGSIEIEDANVNRSPYAYLANPQEERDRYDHDVDKTLTLLRFAHVTDDGDKDIGVLNWFPVHGTSMYGNNTLVTGDNKGVAAWLFEQSTSNSDFVAGFSQSNVGDTSPNVLGAYCEYGEQQGEMCDFKTSLCGNKTQPCHGRGPYYGLNDGGAASNFEIGKRQFAGARKLFDDKSAFTPVSGSVVKGLHQYVDFSHLRFGLPNGTEVQTCPAALGYSFAAGTTDGPGAFDFKQAQPGDPHANPLWKFIGNRVATPNDTQKACHGEKPILLDVGESTDPYDWSPNIVDIQVLRVGQMFVVVSPGEATTMSGRRWREAVHKSVEGTLSSDEEPMVVLGGPANTYAHYIATPEEYSIQRYEGASTLYGPHTLDAFINRTLELIPYLAADTVSLPHPQSGPKPPIFVNDSLSFITPVVVDRAPFFKKFGHVQSDVHANYRAGDTISATFVGANPRNNVRLGNTFAAIDRFNYDTYQWEQVRDDEDWSLVYEWERTSTITGTSEVTISWETHWEVGSEDQADAHGDLMPRYDGLAGRYRLHYYGDCKSINGKIDSFEGVSREFVIA